MLDVDARPGQRPERVVQSLAPNQGVEISPLAARVSQERQIRATRLAVDGAIDDRQESLLAALQVATEPRRGLARVDRATQEAGQVTREADERCQLPRGCHAPSISTRRSG